MTKLRRRLVPKQPRVRMAFATALLKNFGAYSLTAKIRLIPKKGDCSKIKIWRPISLLNCIYKVISKSINNRLKKTVDTITSRAQKGFTNSRYIQEVLINVCHNIGHCNTTGTPAFVLSLDQRKAFDSVRHDFMTEAYKFFGLGNNFIRMLNLITTGRNATIIFDDGSLSRQVLLETGAPQGNSPSPLQYSLCEEIAIIKIELDPNIASVYNHMLIPNQFPWQANQAEPAALAAVPAPARVPVLAPVPDPAPDPVPDPVPVNDLRLVDYRLLPAPPDPVPVLVNPARMVGLLPSDPFRFESNRETDKVQ